MKMLIQNPPVEIVDGLWMLGMNEYPVFLVKDRDEAAIFEGGVGADGPLVAEQLARIEIPVDSVKQIIITHAHPDHVMAVPAFRALFEGVKICASKPAAATLAIEKAVKFFTKIDGMLTDSLIKFGSITEKHRPASLTDYKIPVDRILADGDTIAVGGLEFNVLATLGHSDCSLSFHEPQAGIAIISDITGFYFPDSDDWWPGYFTNYEAYLESIRRLAELNAQVVCLSHNSAIKGADEVRAYFDNTIASTEAYHERIVAEIEAGKSPEELAGQLGTEVYETKPLLPLDFFQKNCALLVKNSMEYAHKNNRQ